MLNLTEIELSARANALKKHQILGVETTKFAPPVHFWG